MKNYLSIMALSIMFVGCQSESEIENEIVQMSRFFISYSLDESVGKSMTRSAASDGWAKFYAKIKSGELVAESYEIIFSNSETNQSYTFNGKWANKEMFILPIGKYKVSGTSNDEGERIQQKCSLIFDTTAEIDENTSEIKLNAGYNCFLLAFGNENIKDISNHFFDQSKNDGNGSENLYSSDDFIYCFVNNQLSGKYYTSDYNYLLGTFKSGGTFKIVTYEAKFQKGKYYIYNNVPSSFDIPEMESGM